MRSCSLLEEPQAEPIASSKLPEMPHTLHPLTKMVPRRLLSKQQALIRVPLVMKHTASRHRGGHLWTREAELGSIPGTQRRGSTTEFPCYLSVCIAPLANGEL